MSDDEEPVKDIRSRIAAFETGSSSSGPKPTTAKKPVLGNRVALPFGQSDPLSQPSRTQLSPSPALSLSPITPSTELIRPKSAGLAGSVQLAGLGNRKQPPPVPGSATRPPVAVKPVIDSQQSKGDQLNTSPTSVKSLQSNIPLAPSRSASPASSPARSPAEEKAAPELSLPPSLPPRLPARKPTIPTKPEATGSNVVVQPPSPLPTSPGSPPPLRKPSASSLGSTSPKPVLPPRKAGSTASSSSLDASSSTAVPRAPQRSSGLASSTATPATMRSPSISTSNPFADAKSSQSSLDDSRSAALPRPPQRNGGSSSSPSATPTTRSSSVGAPNPFADSPFADSSSQAPSRSSTSSTPLPSRPLQASYWSAKPPPPAANTQTAAPVSGSSLSTFATRAPLVKSDINGSEAASKTGMSVGPEGVRRYAELWTGMLDAAEVETVRGQEPRLDAVIVREVWKSSKLSEDVLSRIWSQCDTTRQGSLDRKEFCLGMFKVDEELKRRKRH